MRILTRKNRTHSGLVFDNDGFRFLSLGKNGTAFTVVDSVYEKYPNGMDGKDAFSDAASGIDKYFAFAAEKIGKKNYRVNFALPINETTIRITNLPSGMSLTEATLAFRYDFGSYFPLSEKDGIFDVAEIKYPCEGGRRFIAAAVRRKLIENIEDAAARCGVKLAAIEPTQTAAERSVAPQTGTPCACVYVGNARTFLVFSWQGNGIYYRNIPFNEAEVIAYGDGESTAFAQAADKFADEIVSSFSFGMAQNAGFETQDLRLFGVGASKHLCQFAAKKLPECNISLVSPFSVHGIKTDVGWEVAVGLALRNH